MGALSDRPLPMSWPALATEILEEPYSGLTFGYNANGNWYTPDTSNAQYLVFNPASGQLAIVPEPSTYVLALVGLGTAGWTMHRRKSQRAA